MNNIDTSNIVDPNVQQPFLGPSLKFLQGATKDALQALVLRIIGINGGAYSTSRVYILSGCKNSLVLPNYNISAGYVFFNGEIYYCPAVSGVVPGGKTLYSALDLTYATTGTPDPVTGVGPDPSQFSDGSAFNIHEVRQWKIQALTTGTGANAFSTFVPNGDLITSTTQNGLGIQVDISGSAPFAYNNDVYNFVYRFDNGICKLDGEVTFDITDGAIIERIDIPLPDGVVKNTTYGQLKAMRGVGKFEVPTATSNYGSMMAYSDFGGAEGQRISLLRMDGTTSMTWETGTSAKIRFSIEFPAVL